MEWISVEDRLPIDPEEVGKYETVEVLIVSGGEVEACEFKCGPMPKPWYGFDNYHKAYITHWMPLPEPPQ